MKKNYFIKKPKKGWIVLMLLFCGLFANTATAQQIFTWNGSSDNNWANAANWTVTGSGSTSTYPGQDSVTKTDQVVINNGSVANAPIIYTSVPNAIDNLLISNATAPAPTLTINSGVSLTVTSAANNPVVLNGGNIVNNGILDIKTTITGVVAAGISCGNPAVAPGPGSIYGYSGSGEFKIDISAANTQNSSAIIVTGLNTNTTYRFLFNGTTTIKLATAATQTYAIRASATYVAGGQEPAKVLVGGTGFTLGSVGTPVSGGVLSITGGNNVTVDIGTVLSLYSAATNATDGINVNSNLTTVIPTSFINKGTINILGTTSKNGILLSPFSVAGVTNVINFENQNIINVDIIATAATNAALQVPNNGAPTTPSPGILNITNTSGAVMTLKNNQPQTGANIGCAVRIFNNTQTANVNLTNNGVINFSGNNDNFGGQVRTILTNNGIINSNYNFANSTITNNEAGIFNFSKPTATFTVLIGVAATAGATYTDVAGNSFTVLTTKVAGTGTALLLLRENSVAAVTPATATLTKTSGIGDTPITYTAVATPVGAIAAAATNSGTINTGKGVDSCGRLFGVTSTTATSVIAPGGSIEKGVANFTNTSHTLRGKFIIQVAGSTKAGVDYDQITNSAAGTLDITGATLDVTGIYTPASSTAIDIVTTTGTLTGTFGPVIGLTTGWSVVYTTGTGGKVQLVYDPFTPATSTTWTGGTSTGWNNTANWLDGIVPDQNSDVTITTGTFQPSPFVNVNIKSLTIDSGATLTVNPTYNFTVKQAIVNNGTITILNNANLIQVDDVANTGTGSTIVNRNSNALSRLDYTIWSSPVANQNLLAFSPDTTPTRFYNYNETTNLYNAVDPANSFATASGYLIRMPNTAVTAPSTQIFSGVFIGVPNNGTITKAVTYNGSAPYGYNMVGNPYPSTIDAQAFIAANTANIESSLYFWRKTNGATGSAYAIYNPLGGTAATPTSDLPNGIIQVSQGFFVKAKSASNVTFTNAMRVANNQNKFFKTKQVQKDRVWLNLTNTSGIFSQALVGYTTDASQGVDMYDAKYFNDSPIALTSNINNEEYTIQGRPAFDVSDVVALNFKTDAAGDYSIALDHFDGIFATGQYVYLVDSKTGTETDLKAGAYTFNAVAGVDNVRFSLKYQKTLKVDAPAFNENSVRVYKNNGTLYVNSGAVAISNIKVFDMQGRLIVEQKNVKATTAVFNNLRAKNQVLIVEIAGEDNNVVTKKVVN